MSTGNNPESESKKKSRLWLKIGICVLPFAMIAVTLLFTGLPIDEVISEAHITSAKFSNDFEIQILDAVVAKKLNIPGRYKPPKWREFIGGGGGSSSTETRGLRFTLRYQKEEVTSMDFEGAGEGLLLSVRLLAPDGSEVRPEYAVIDTEPELIKVKRDKEDRFDGIEEIGLKVSPQPKPEYFFEVGDESGGWMVITGPFAIGNDDGRAFVSAAVFPRANPKLKLRVNRPGIDPVVLEIANPGYSTTAASATPWKVNPKPWKQNLTFATVELLELREYKRAFYGQPNGTGFNPSYRITSNVSDQKDSAFAIRTTSMSDEQGNILKYGRLRIPSLDKIKIRGSLTQANDFQWDESVIDFIAEGVWTGKKTQEDLKILPEGVSIGLAAMKLSLDTTATSKVPKWIFELTGEGPTGKISTALDLIIFEGDARQSKNVTHNRSGGSSSNNGMTKYSSRTTYFQNIVPGRKIRVGLAPQNTFENFEFIIPIEKP